MARFEVTVSPEGDVRVSGREGLFGRESRIHVDDRVLDDHLSHHFDGPIADLVDVALAVYAADRLCRRPRRRNRYEHFWHRRIHMSVPVRAPEVWRNSEVRTRLQDALALLTDDDWTFEFARRQGTGRLVQGQLFDPRPRPPVTACLFSGGLDSFAGLCRDLLHDSNHTFVLFSGYTQGRLASIQGELAEALLARCPKRLRLVQVPFGITHEGHSYNDDERTQRSRGFVHGVLGGAIGLACGSDSLRCYENGVGALNLPITDAQLGTHNARSAHPVVLEQIAELLQRVAGRDFRIELPNVFETKATMCRALAGTGLGSMVARTVSCDSFPLRIRGKKQCGCCTSCVLRRQALKVAGLQQHDHGDSYRYDLHDVGSWVGDDVTFGMSAMLYQVHRIRQALSHPDRWYGLARAFPELEQTVVELAGWGWDPGETRKGILQLYSTYSDDWSGFAQQALTLAA